MEVSSFVWNSQPIWREIIQKYLFFWLKNCLLFPVGLQFIISIFRPCRSGMNFWLLNVTEWRRQRRLRTHKYIFYLTFNILFFTTTIFVPSDEQHGTRKNIRWTQEDCSIFRFANNQNWLDHFGLHAKRRKNIVLLIERYQEFSGTINQRQRYIASVPNRNGLEASALMADVWTVLARAGPSGGISAK